MTRGVWEMYDRKRAVLAYREARTTRRVRIVQCMTGAIRPSLAAAAPSGHTPLVPPEHAPPAADTQPAASSSG